ncbi:MAG: NUDIX hydrolase N-terminal domain-containing protein [Prolixibacteraceae bacterium]
MKYSHIIFDVDGTLVDTEKALLCSLQDTVFELKGERPDLADLKFSFGIPGDVTLKQLGIGEIERANQIWYDRFNEYYDSVVLFPGIEALIRELHSKGYRLGIVTSRNRMEFGEDFPRFGLSEYFGTVVCAGDSPESKPQPGPMLKYLETAGISAGEALYIGDTIYDWQCAAGAGVDFGLALWGHNSARHIRADYFFGDPCEIDYRLSLSRPEQIPWMKWAMELQFIAQAGITYSDNAFDLERFERIRELSAEIMHHETGKPLDYIKDVFCSETGFQTPKLDTRAAIFQDGKILLVRESDGRWSLPGGWVDVNESIRNNTVKEVKEEAGLDVAAVKLIALQDRNLHNTPQYAFGITKAFVLCELVGGCFVKNHETIESAYFSLDEIPPLALEKTSEAQIKLCFDAYHAENWTTVFD